MAGRNAFPWTFRPAGLTDSVDGTNSAAGSMQSLANLVPSYGTEGVFVPRPAATTAFSLSPNTAVVSALVTVGNRAYGWKTSSIFPGKDEPFCYDFSSAGFVPIQGMQAALLPASAATTGDWTPPCVVAATNSWILFLHPGFPGGSGPYFGWLDISGYSTTVVANTTAGSAVLTGVVTTIGSSAPILQGVQPGQVVYGNGIPLLGQPGLSTEGGALIGLEGGGVLGMGVGDYVTSCANGTLSLSTTGNTNGTTTVSSVANTTGVIPGTLVSGPQFLAGTYVTGVSGSTITLNQAAIGTATGTAIAFSGNGTITLGAAATATASNVTVTIAGGTFAQPLWGAGNTNTNPLSQVPSCAAGFNSRGWYGVGPYAVYSDPLLPLQVSLASQALVIGDNTSITALASVPLTSQLTGGIQQSLTVFKGAASLTQITGDPLTSNLAQNTVAGSVGTLAANTLAQTPYGIAFMAVDGLRILGLTGTVSEPIGSNGTGVVVPFLNAVYPSRMCASYAQDVYRITVQNGYKPTQPLEEYWFNFKTKQWTGPHSCPLRVVAAFQSGSAFLGAPYAANGVVRQSSVLPTSSSVYIENGAQLTWTYQTSSLPDNGAAKFNKIVQSSLAMALRITDIVQVSAIDDTGKTIGSVSVSGTAPGPSLWGGANWGSGTWGAANPNLREITLPWMQPLVYRQASLLATSASAGGQAIGNAYANIMPVNFNTPIP